MPNDKSQLIRLLDVYAVGPYLLQAARIVKSKKIRVGLVILGLATMFYNGRNYNLTKEGETDGRSR